MTTIFLIYAYISLILALAISAILTWRDREMWPLPVVNALILISDLRGVVIKHWALQQPLYALWPFALAIAPFLCLRRLRMRGLLGASLIFALAMINNSQTALLVVESFASIWCLVGLIAQARMEMPLRQPLAFFLAAHIGVLFFGPWFHDATHWYVAQFAYGTGWIAQAAWCLWRLRSRSYCSER